ncbi:SUMF1/EgtB/PvdO family nonheme iron enzyme [bacterium]|nr:SUMF1/EgtB/PvdO family nonheme iron enzyme [bacterium]
MKSFALSLVLLGFASTALLGQSSQNRDSSQSSTSVARDTTQQSPVTKAALPDTASVYRHALKWIADNSVLVTVILVPFLLFLWSILSGQNQIPRFKKWLTRRGTARRYRRYLRYEHEKIDLLGFQAEANIKVRTLDVFVSLRLEKYGRDALAPERATLTYASAKGLLRERRKKMKESEKDDISFKEAQSPEELMESLSERQKNLKQPDIDISVMNSLSPEKLLQHAFFEHNLGRLLLILGDPGSGKTTLLKYYAMCCFDRAGRRLLGLPKPLMPIFVPLRKVDPNKLFCEALCEAATNPNKPVPKEFFEHWLDRRGALVLLDGLDEISEVPRRRLACKWIDQACAAYPNSYFIVTSRYTGYRVSEGVELYSDLQQAVVRELNDEQQEVFLKKWFHAAYRGAEDSTVNGNNAEQAQQVANAVRNYLQQEENASLRQLAGTPVLLQIMAILWKEYGTLVSGRAGLYEKCTDYLLDRRERVRDLPPPLPAEKAKIVLRPIALFMQEILKSHDISAADLEERMARPLEEVKPELAVSDFIAHLRDRAGLLKAHGDHRYVFSHNSFREFLAAGELAEQIKQKPKRSRVLVESFNEGWWRETLLFSLSLTKPVIFREFFEYFLPHPHNSDGFPELLTSIIMEAPRKEIAPFESFVPDSSQAWQNRYNALMCLRLMRSDSAEALLKKTWEDLKRRPAPRDPKEAEGVLRLTQKAEEILIEWKLVRPTAPAAKATPVTAGAKSFRNPFELEAEYILIPGGKYNYSVTKNEVEVPPLYFAKYTVTNKLYRRFIAYLTPGKSVNEALAVLPGEQFAKSLLSHAAEIKGFQEYLGKDASLWATKLKSGLDDDKRFNGEDQPVVGVSWFAAIAYSFWLSELQKATGKQQKEGLVYRLPTEQEWEWAAGFDRLTHPAGSPTGGKRKYPWGNEEPDETRANYGEKVGKTTPVGSYPAGATPEGLMDMAGNVWEWMENKYTPDKEWRALRGGSWSYASEYLPCAARGGSYPVSLWNYVAFRVVAVQSIF